MADHARPYLTGLVGTQRRRNIETIENDVKGSNYQGMEQFISSSPWSTRSLLDDVDRGADAQFGDEENASLSIDESGFLKKGNASVDVFASLGCGERYSLIDFDLFLPEDWSKDSERCEKQKFPMKKRGL